MGTRYGVDEDDDVDMSVPQPLYEFIKAPRLTQWDHTALIEWYRLWNQYKTKIEHRCSVTGESFENVAATIKGCIKPDVLENIAAYVLEVDVDSVTDSMLLRAIGQRCQSVKNGFAPDLKTLFATSLKMDMAIDDCEARVFSYFQQFNKIVEDNGLQRLNGRVPQSDSSRKEKMKIRCSLLVENLRPAVLKAHVERLITLERRDCRTDDVKLYKLVLEQAKTQQQYHRDDQSKKPKSKLEVANAKPDRPRGAGGAGSGSSGTPKHSGSQGGKQDGARDGPPPKDGCLVCGGSHWMRKCPTATEEQKRAALGKLWPSSARAVRARAAEHSDGQKRVLLNDVLSVPYVPDTGADRCMVPKAVVNFSLRLALQCSLVVYSPLSTSSSLMAARLDAMKKPYWICLQLITAAGAVRVSAVWCMVWQSSDEEL
ncbi:TPA: hypothetical protein N0F65_003056 [Lagenidium giganteum]|uniref:Uncharacterized protein n=1 Tax=Lagenidium giganteum TaxID=4803 RepID=A0AAV2YGI3_9STRA|nr:TPA: hypothetical protein N0F65_003056 [Lagenidium giganteum]